MMMAANLRPAANLCREAVGITIRRLNLILSPTIFDRHRTTFYDFNYVNSVLLSVRIVKQSDAQRQAKWDATHKINEINKIKPKPEKIRMVYFLNLGNKTGH